MPSGVRRDLYSPTSHPLTLQAPLSRLERQNFAQLVAGSSETARGASLPDSQRPALRVSSPQGVSGGRGLGEGNAKVLEGCQGASRKPHDLQPPRPDGPGCRHHKGKGLVPLLSSPPRATRRSWVRRGGGGARQVTSMSRVPGPESQSPRPPRASPTTARSPRVGSPAPHNGLGTRPPPSGAVEGLQRAASGRRSPEVRAVPALSRPRATSYPLACSVSSSLSPSIPHVSWSSSSRLCWLAADSLSSAIAAAPSGGEGGAPCSKRGATGRARPQLPLVPPTLGPPVWSLRPRPPRGPSHHSRHSPAHLLAAPAVCAV